MTRPLILLITIGFIIYLTYRNLPLFFFIMANRRYSEDKIDQAMALYEKAYKFKHNKPAFKIMYSYVLVRNGNIDRAEDVLNEVSKERLVPKDEINVALNKSLVMWKKGDLDKAVELLETAMNKGYKNSTIYQNLGYYLILKGDYSKALEFNLEGYEYNNDDSGLLDNLAMNYYFLGEYDKAIEIYEKLMAKNPSFVSAYYYYGKTLAAKNNYEEALKMFNEALKCRFSAISAIDKMDIEKEINATKQLLNNK